jgi:hypothetical protein
VAVPVPIARISGLPCSAPYSHSGSIHIFITFSSHFHHILYTFITLIHHTVTSGYSGNCHRLWELWPYLVNIIVQYFRVTGCPKSQGCEATRQMCSTALYFYGIPITRTEDEGLGGHSPWTTSMGRQSQVGATFLIQFCLWCLWCLTWINMTDLALCSIFIFLIPLRWRKAPKTKQTWSIVINHGKGTPPGTSESGAKPTFKESEDNLDFSFAAEWHSRRHLEAFLIQFLSFWSRKVAPVVLPWV